MDNTYPKYGVFHAKDVEVRAEQFNRNEKPWPDRVEVIYAEGIPRPMIVTTLGNLDIRSGDWIVSGNFSGVIVVPNHVFVTLFDFGPKPKGEETVDPQVESPVPALDLEKVQANVAKYDQSYISPHDAPIGPHDTTAKPLDHASEKIGWHEVPDFQEKEEPDAV